MMKILLVGGLFNATQIEADNKGFNKSNTLSMISAKNQGKPFATGDCEPEMSSLEIEYHHYKCCSHGPSEHPGGNGQLIYFYDSTTTT